MYTLTTVHTSAPDWTPTPRVAYFNTCDAALAAAPNPEEDGSLVPNVPEYLVNEETYSRGVFWCGNRCAVIHEVPDPCHCGAPALHDLKVCAEHVTRR